MEKKTALKKYSFSNYDPQWAVRFENIKELLSKIFGNKVLQVEHIGSTAVPGMKAKPVIDVLVTVKNIEDIAQERQALVNDGYEWREENIAPGALLFFKLTNTGEKSENIHVCPKDTSKIQELLVVRDFLRTFPEKAKEYSDVKQRIAQEFPSDYPAYRQAKTAFMERLQEEANVWQKISGAPGAVKKASSPTGHETH